MKNRAFTLIELIAVLVIMSIITLLATPNIISLMNKGKEDSFRPEVKTILTKSISTHKEDDKESFDLAYMKANYDLNPQDPYGYTYDQFDVNFSYGSNVDANNLPKPSSREMRIRIKSCKGSRCHCIIESGIKQVEEIDKVSISTNCNG